MWGGDLRVYSGNLRGADGPNFGLALNYSIAQGTQLEGFWFIQSGDLKFYEYGVYDDILHVFDMNTNYIHLGILSEMNHEGAVRPFGTFSLGTTIFNIDDSYYNTVWRFSVGFGAGSKFYISDRIGFRIQGRLLMPIYFSGAGVWCGADGYCAYGTASPSIMAQADITGGIIIVIQ